MILYEFFPMRLESVPKVMYDIRYSNKRLTATIDPKGMSGLSVSDIPTRTEQYLSGLQFYLAGDEIERIVLVENSGFDLAEFRTLASQYPENFIFCSWLSVFGKMATPITPADRAYRL